MNEILWNGLDDGIENFENEEVLFKFLSSFCVYKNSEELTEMINNIEEYWWVQWLLEYLLNEELNIALWKIEIYFFQIENCIDKLWFHNSFSGSDEKLISTYLNLIWKIFVDIDLIIAFSNRYWLLIDWIEEIRNFRIKYLESIWWVWDENKHTVYWIEKLEDLMRFNIETLLNSMSEEECFDYLESIYSRMSDDYFKDEEVMKSNSMFTNIFRIWLYKKINWISNSDKKKEYIFRLANLSSWRNISIPTFLCDPNFAIEILSDSMFEKWWAFETLIDENNWIDFIDDSLYESPKSIVDKFVKYDEWWNIVRLLWIEKLLKIAENTEYTELPLDQRILVSTLDRVNKILKEETDIGKINFQTFFLRVNSQITSMLTEQMNENLKWWYFDFYWLSWEKLWLSWVDLDMFDLYKDILWVWILDFADNTNIWIIEYWKLPVIIWVWIVTAVLLAPVSWWMSLVWASSLIWWAVWVTATWASLLLSWQWYKNLDETFREISIDILVNWLTWAVWGWVTASLWRMWAWFSSKEAFYRSLNNYLLLWWDMTLWLWWDYLAQRYLLWRDIDIKWLIESWSIMLLIWILVSSIKLERLWFKSREWIRDLVDFDMNWNTLVINELNWREHSDILKAFMSIMINNDISKVVISPNISWESKRIIHNILWRNNPLVEIVRIVPWHKVVNISFWWIKRINDRFKPAFTDLLLDTLKNKIKSNCRSNITEWMEHARIVRDDYKHLTLSIPESADIVDLLFWWIASQKQILDSVIESLSEEIQRKAIEVWMSKDFVESVIRDNITIWVWYSTYTRPQMWQSGDLVENLMKLKAFYESENASRWLVFPDLIKPNEYSIERIESTARFTMDAERDFLREYWDQMFEVWWVSYPVSMVLVWNKRVINPALIRFVRKGKETEPFEIGYLVLQYIRLLNEWFDFISPRNWTRWWFERAQSINDSINEWFIDSINFFRTYKWTYSKNYINEYVRNVEWTSVFIDIKDMWIMNIESLRNLADIVSTWKYDRTVLLTSLNDVTNMFLKFVNCIQKRHPNAVIALWWDEVYIHFPWKSQDFIMSELGYLSSDLRNNWLQWRITYLSKNDWVDNIFDYLDRLTRINKMFEERIESYLIENNRRLDLKRILNTSFTIQFRHYTEDIDKLISSYIDEVWIWSILDSIFANWDYRDKIMMNWYELDIVFELKDRALVINIQ